MTRWPRRRQAWGCAVTLAAAAVVLSAGLSGAAAAPLGAQRGQAAAAAHGSARLLSSDSTPPPVNTTLYQGCVERGEKLGLKNVFTDYVAGYADDAKQDESVPVGSPGPGFVSGLFSEFDISPNPVIDGRAHRVYCAMAQVNLDYQGLEQLPPVTASFTAFGFEPVTVTMQMVQDGPDPLTAVLYEDSGPTSVPNTSEPWTAVVTGQLALQVTAVSVNGVPLDVGSSCRTAGDLSTPGNPVAPGQLLLQGGGSPGDPVPWFAGFLTGGMLAGAATIPPFTGCVSSSGEDLDPLLTAAASGPGNYVQLMQGVPCAAGLLACRSGNLPPGPPPLFTVTGGGRYHASGTMTIVAAYTSLSITCDSRVSGVFPDLSGPLRGGLASVNWTQISNCKGNDGTTWQVTATPTASFAGSLYCDSQIPAALQGCPDGEFQDLVSDVSLELTQTGAGASPACTDITMTGNVPAAYAPGALLLQANPVAEANAELVVDSASACPDLPGSGTSTDFGIIATYDLQGASPDVTPVFP